MSVIETRGSAAADAVSHRKIQASRRSWVVTATSVYSSCYSNRLPTRLHHPATPYVSKYTPWVKNPVTFCNNS